MFDVHDETQGDVVGVGAGTGFGHRRYWSAAERARIVADTVVPDARLSEVAQRWRVSLQQLYRWRHAAGVTSSPGKRPQAAVPGFVPIVSAAAPVGVITSSASARPVIEVRLAGAVVRVVSGTEDAPLTAVLRAIRASASRR